MLPFCDCFFGTNSAFKTEFLATGSLAIRDKQNKSSIQCYEYNYDIFLMIVVGEWAEY